MHYLIVTNVGVTSKLFVNFVLTSNLYICINQHLCFTVSLASILLSTYVNLYSNCSNFSRRCDVTKCGMQLSSKNTSFQVHAA